MKRFYLIFAILLLREANSRPLRKDPAFAKPLYSNSYLPAAMQVIFYAVEQLKAFQAEEPEPTTTVAPPTTTAIPTTIATTMSHEPGQHQPKPMEAVIQQISTQKPVLSQEASVVELETVNTNESTPSSNHEMPELGEETPEASYGTPEINHEMPEEIHETQEVNQENSLPEKNEEKPESNSNDKFQATTAANDDDDDNDMSQQDGQSSSSSSTSLSEEKQPENEKNKRQPTVDSVVKEIYGIMKPQDNSKDSSVKSESKKPKEADDDSDEDEDEDEDEDDGNDDNRFTLLGEKVSQVPRPSLSNYLRRSSKTPPKCSIQQLALLYDALSKDARKQGFAKFSGYSDEVLKTLQASVEGGIGPQLQKLLEKILERNEVTRDDAKAKIVETLKELNKPGSEINRDLRRLLPLRFNP